MGRAIELRQRANREDILSIETLSRAPTAFIDLLTERASAIKLAEPGPSPEQLSAMLKAAVRSEEHTSELQSLMRISYAVFCLKKKNKKQNKTTYTTTQT